MLLSFDYLYIFGKNLIHILHKPISNILFIRQFHYHN